MLLHRLADWMLEGAHQPDPFSPKRWTAWVSDPERHIVGYARGTTQGDAVRDAITNALRRCKWHRSAIRQLEAGYAQGVANAATG